MLSTEVENRHVRLPYCDCRPVTEERPAISMWSIHCRSQQWNVLQILYQKAIASRKVSNIRWAICHFEHRQNRRFSVKYRQILMKVVHKFKMAATMSQNRS